MKKFLRSLLFPILGAGSLGWFLIRVIPKPSRAGYPCMRAAAPLASAFVVYLVGLLTSVVLFKKSRQFRAESRRALASLSLFAAVALALGSFLQDSHEAHAMRLAAHEGPNQPMGTGVGIHPGRVAWIHDPDATDSKCANERNDYWYQDDNTNQAVVNSMLSRGLQMLTGEGSDAAAWNALFHYFNRTHGRGDVGYTAGEKIVIKINLNAVSQGAKNINTSPQMDYALLDQLIRVVGVSQADIHIGDPNITPDAPTIAKTKTAFPNVKVWGFGAGLTPVVGSGADVILASDNGMQNQLPQPYLDASYMINMSVLKKHHRGGISMGSKNHFGSITAFNSNGAFPWHYSLPCPDGGADNSNGDYHQYRCFVDIMGHQDLGGKTLLYLVDGIWSSINWGHPPIKWSMAPFNNDWPSSLFLSEDPVAIESVGYDLLYEEFGPTHPTEGAYDPADNHGPFPHYAGVDDFLHQAADSTNWPAGLVYDPEQDGTPLHRSMGTHEHWNNATDKQYSRNLGLDTGIELVYQKPSAVATDPSQNRGLAVGYELEQNYPNPFNPSTEIRFRLSSPTDVRIDVVDSRGRQVRTLADGLMQAGDRRLAWDGRTADGSAAPSGVYFCRMILREGGSALQQSRKMVLSR
jgi:hypothetical protein